MPVPTSYGLGKGWPVAVGQAIPTLGTLTLSPLTATVGVSYSGTISGATIGSTVGAISDDATALTVTGTDTTRSVSGTFSGAGTPTVTMTETYGPASNSPHQSTANVTVSAASSSNNGALVVALSL